MKFNQSKEFPAYVSLNVFNWRLIKVVFNKINNIKKTAYTEICLLVGTCCLSSYIRKKIKGETYKENMKKKNN